ncbi:Uncharacterised protein [Legionella wadsworthii]|uniref:Uncharacterized protein n=1 Tax=Legionella wadsworthii TaxID=28088 RepID=A0A378LYE3_9GAMM|nr:hypothetical protein [Legionella wadsworthii]STY31734.1 Uncharacterised protein [Legionella wadsworthii]
MQKRQIGILKGLISPSLKRQLSVAYIAPDGRLTSDDPNSYSGKERVAYQNALIKQHPDTGYADSIIKERQEKKKSAFFQPKKEDEKDKINATPTLS